MPPAGFEGWGLSLLPVLRAAPVMTLGLLRLLVLLVLLLLLLLTQLVLSLL